jgi:hypothetical protein
VKVVFWGMQGGKTEKYMKFWTLKEKHVEIFGFNFQLNGKPQTPKINFKMLPKIKTTAS